MSPNEVNNMQSQNIPASDQIDKNKSIYDVSGFEVFWRNFIAGASRTLGGLILYILIFVGLASVVNKYMMPYILPLVETLQTSVNSLNQLNSGKNQVVDETLNKPELQNILNNINK